MNACQLLQCFNLRGLDIIVEYRHDMVPGDFEDPGRCEGRPTFLLLKLCYFLCCTIEHHLGIHV